jgi:RNA polymerase sigma factor (TIGR02999 family)
MYSRSARDEATFHSNGLREKYAETRFIFGALDTRRESKVICDRQAYDCAVSLLRRGTTEIPTPEDQSGQFTKLLHRWTQGDENALHTLVPLVYRELRRLAHYHLQSERPDHTLQSTALVHEAYLRLLGGQPEELQNRPHFIALASRLMRQILVDYARGRRANKRDCGSRIPFEYLDSLPVKGDAELLALNDALDELSRIDERQGKIVEMKFFGGLSAPEISRALGISRATVDRDWATARVWLHRQLSKTA